MTTWPRGHRTDLRGRADPAPVAIVAITDNMRGHCVGCRYGGGLVHCHSRMTAELLAFDVCAGLVTLLETRELVSGAV